MGGKKMGLKEIIGKLDWLLDTEKNRTTKQAETIDALLVKLVEKEAKYIKQLRLAESDRKREKIERKIKVCRAQIAKGRAASRELRTESV